MISFFGTEREYSQNDHIYDAAFKNVMRSGQTIGGEHVDQIEKLVSSLCSCHLPIIDKEMHAVAVGSGTDALFFALKAAGIGCGDKVITTAFSFIATQTTIYRAQATPAFVDIEPETALMDLDKIPTPCFAKAVVFVDLFGVCPDFSNAESFCETRNLFLIEDAAQSFGGYSGNRPAGNMGDYACVSFDPTNVIGAPGGGGIVLCSSKERADEVRKMRYKGELGCNSQMSELDAAIILYKLGRIQELIAKRRMIAEYYNDNIKDRNFLRKTPFKPSVYQKYVLDYSADDTRVQFVEYMAEKNIPTKIHYPYILANGCKYNEYVNAKEAADAFVSIPIHPYLTDDEVEYIVKTINECDII